MPEMTLEFLQTLLLLGGGGLLAGLLAGLLGIGGGIVMVPVLFLIFTLQGAAEAWRMHIAVATALAVIAPTTLSAARAHWRRHSVDGTIARNWAPMVALGSAGGALVASSISSQALILIFAVLAGLMGIKMLLPLDNVSVGRPLPVRGAGRIAPAVIGAVSALMGIGGATFTVPYLTLFDVPIHRAVGTAALIGSIVAIVGVGGYAIGGWGRQFDLEHTLGFIHLPSLLVVAPVSVLAAPLGARIAHALPRRTLSVVFGIFLLATSGRLLASVL